MRADRFDRYQYLSAHGVSLMVPIVPRAGDHEGDPKMPTANTAAQLYLSDLKPKVARETHRKRRYHLESFLTHVGGTTEVRKIKQPHIEAWLFAKAISPATVKLRFLTVRQFFDFCLSRGWIRKVPYTNVTLPRVAKKQPRALTRADLLKLVEVLPDERARLIVALGVNEGLRRVEIARLELGDINFQDRTLTVATAKANTEDLIPLTDATAGFLDLYLTVRGRAPGALIQSQYGGPLTPDTIGMLFCKWMIEAGVKEAPFDGKSLHACRHTFALNLLHHGADPTVIQAGLRHTTLGSTWTYLRSVRDVERLRPFMGHKVKEAS